MVGRARVVKHERAIICALKDAGCTNIRVVNDAKRHRHIHYTDAKGVTWSQGVSSSPKNVDHCVRAFMREYKRKQEGNCNE